MRAGEEGLTRESFREKQFTFIPCLENHRADAGVHLSDVGVARAVLAHGAHHGNRNVGSQDHLTTQGVRKLPVAQTHPATDQLHGAGVGRVLVQRRQHRHAGHDIQKKLCDCGPVALGERVIVAQFRYRS